MMTKDELIKQLEKLPENLEVVIRIGVSESIVKSPRVEISKVCSAMNSVGHDFYEIVIDMEASL